MGKSLRLEPEARTLVWGLPIITILVWTASTMDPVNLPKLVVLAVVAFSTFFAVISKFRVFEDRVSNLFVFIHFGLLVWILISTVKSDTNFIQSFFGVNGRYTGALTYICFSLIALVVFLLSSKLINEKILVGLVISGLINVIYCAVVILTNTDPIPWKNIYGNILGTFGNPNFISSFLGIFNTVLISKILAPTTTRRFALPALMLVGISVWEIIDSQSRQGLIVTAIGFGSVLVYRVLTSTSNRFIKPLAIMTYLIAGVFSVLGMLQIGPLTTYIYKLSVSIRGAYWRAGWETMLQNPIFGVGPDSFGDWYTRVRDERAMVVPGPDVFTNSPHNVFIEQGVNGGIPLFFLYVSLQALIFYCGIQYIRKSRDYDYFFAAAFFGWLGFTAQSIISINQIGLAIWGYVLGGMTIAIYVNSMTQTNHVVSKQQKAKIQEFSFLKVVSGGLVGLFFALPPFYADARWRSALTSTELNRILAAANQWPQNTDRYIEVSKLLYKNSYNKETLDFVREGLSFNSNNIRLWYFLYQLPNSTEAEKKLAIEKMKVLDPNFIVK
jgi:O-antigen ligase